MVWLTRKRHNIASPNKYHKKELGAAHAQIVLHLSQQSADPFGITVYREYQRCHNIFLERRKRDHPFHR